MTDYAGLLRVLANNKIEFIVVGGVAAKAHGSARFTVDVDVVYRRTKENIARIVAAFAGLHPYPRGAPPGLPFKWDAETIEHGLNFTLTSDQGPIDFLGEIAGGGIYDQLLPHVESKAAFDIAVPCLKLEKLIEVKKAAARRKDLEAIAELTALLEEREKHEPGAVS
jgi:predicted nucleotidyltransferase